MASTYHSMYKAICLKHVFLSFVLWKFKTRLLVYLLAQTSYSNLAIYKFWFSSSCWLFGKLYHLVWLAIQNSIPQVLKAEYSFCPSHLMWLRDLLHADPTIHSPVIPHCDSHSSRESLDTMYLAMSPNGELHKLGGQ